MTGVMLKHGVGKGTGVRLYKITLSLLVLIFNYMNNISIRCLKSEKIESGACRSYVVALA